jgi:hypothetical protein
VYAFGTDMVVQRGAPFEIPPAGSRIMRMNTTIVQFGGNGNDPLLGGPFTLELDPAETSDGYIQQCDTCDDSWAESHWTIHYMLLTSLPWPMDTVRGSALMDLDCDDNWNPGDPFTPPDDVYNDPRHVPVYDNNGNIIGYTVKQHSVNVDPQEGACCFGTDCVYMSGPLCVEQGGVYKGDGVPCVPNPCEDPIGACCEQGTGLCFPLTQADCESAQGTYMGDGVPCDPNPCSCCMPPIRGNINFDPGDQIDISDLVYLVDYMFTNGPAPPCFEEADMNCDGSIDISDLVWIVDYMFTGGPAPCRCDCTDCLKSGSNSKIGSEVKLRWSALVDPQSIPQHCYR